MSEIPRDAGKIVEPPSSFDIARIRALKQYAELEAEICMLLGAIMRIKLHEASAIFYQITNTRTRYAIINNLLKMRHRGLYARSWPKIEKWLYPCDTARNHIIHWAENYTVVFNLGSTDPINVVDIHFEWHLKNSTHLWRAHTESPRYEEKDIIKARDDMRVMMHIIDRFYLTVREPKQRPWTDIFQQPITDRTPLAFLKRLNDAGRPAQLPPYDL